MKRALIALATVVSLAVGPAFAKTVHVYGIVANINGSKLVLTDPYGIKRIVKAQTYCLGAGWGGRNRCSVHRGSQLLRILHPHQQGHGRHLRNLVLLKYRCGITPRRTGDPDIS